MATPHPAQFAVWFEVTTAGTSFYLDRSAEIPGWSYNWIQDNPDAFQTEMRVLFSSHILVEHQGDRTVLRLFENGGGLVRQFAFTQGLGLNRFRKRHFTLYPPLFAQSTN